MSEPKTLTPQEALRALADGKKLHEVDSRHYICLSEGYIFWEDESPFNESFDGFVIYTEPKPKRKVAPYLMKGNEVFMTYKFYESYDEAKSDFAPNTKIIRRVTELEVEIED